MYVCIYLYLNVFVIYTFVFTFNRIYFKRLTIVTLDHKTSLKCQFIEIEINTSSEAEYIIFPLMCGLLW